MSHAVCVVIIFVYTPISHLSLSFALTVGTYFASCRFVAIVRHPQLRRLAAPIITDAADSLFNFHLLYDLTNNDASDILLFR